MSRCPFGKRNIDPVTYDMTWLYQVTVLMHLLLLTHIHTYIVPSYVFHEWNIFSFIAYILMLMLKKKSITVNFRKVSNLQSITQYLCTHVCVYRQIYDVMYSLTYCVSVITQEWGHYADIHVMLCLSAYLHRIISGLFNQQMALHSVTCFFYKFYNLLQYDAIVILAFLYIILNV